MKEKIRTHRLLDGGSDYSCLVEATGFEPAASASRTQRSTKLSHASISIILFSKNYEKFRICGYLCGRSRFIALIRNTARAIKWHTLRDCLGSVGSGRTVRYGIPNQAHYQTVPHPDILYSLAIILYFFSFVNCHFTVFQKICRRTSIRRRFGYVCINFKISVFTCSYVLSLRISCRALGYRIHCTSNPCLCNSPYTCRTPSP